MKKQQGFTLIELMIVVAVIGVLSAIAIPQYQKYVAKAEVASALATLTGLKTNIEAYTIENGIFPPNADLEELGAPEEMDLGVISLSGHDGNQGNLAFTFNPSTTHSVSSLVSEKTFYLGRNDKGTWTCKNSGVKPLDEELLPRNCKTKKTDS